MNNRGVWACVSFLFVSTLCAAEKTWTGSAGNFLFSADANWTPAGAPEDGDTLFFANSSDLSVVNDIAGRTYAGLTTSGSGLVTLQASGNGFTLSGNVVVSGSKDLNIYVPVTLDTAVTFNLSNANCNAYGALSGSGSITIEGGKNFYAKDAVTVGGGVIVNRGRLRVEKSSFTAPVTLNQLNVGGVRYVALVFQNSGTYSIPITINNTDGNDFSITAPAGAGVHVTNTAAVTLSPNAYTRWGLDGSITFAGGIIVQTPARSDMAIVFNGNNVIRGVPVAFANDLYVDSGNLRLAVAGNTYADLKCYTKTVFTEVPFALDPDKNVSFGVSYSKSGGLDINGNDQIINRPVLNTFGGLDISSYILTSSSRPATLTCRATGGTTFFGSLDGALSLSWEPLSNAHTFTLTGRVSQTTGTLQVKSGTLCLAAGASLPNLSGLVATNTGILRVDGATLPPVPLTVADTAQLSLPDGVTFSCLTAQVDGTTLVPGQYTAASNVNGRAFITGGGTLAVLSVPLSGTVRTWTGAGGDTLFSTAGNWDSAPAFDGSETFLFAEAGSTATVDNVYLMGAVRFNRGTPFTLVPAGENAALWLGLGGVTVLAPVAGTPVAHTNAVPLALSYASAWQIGSNLNLVASGRVSGGTPTAPFTKTGDGTLRLIGTNTFESPFVISNGFVTVNNGKAFGNPTNTITVIPTTSDIDNWNRRGPLYFTDTVATNDRPLIYGPSVYFIGQTYPKNGTLVLNGKFTFLGGGRIDNQGTLLFRGGFWSRNGDPWMQTWPGNVMRFEGQPLEAQAKTIGVDNGGTFHVSAVSNSWGQVSFSSGTFLCGAAGVMPTNSFVSFGRSWTQSGFLDLNGFDQQVKYLAYSAGTTATTNLAVKSATPATLTLRYDTLSTRPFIGYFSGKASLRHLNGGTLAFTGSSSASTTTGDLLVEAGTVAFRSGAKWTGSTNITVTAGTLSVEGGAGATFGGNSATLNVTRLHLTSASTVNLAAGVTDYVRAATLNGKHLPIGSYGSLSSNAQYKSPRFTGDGILYVLRSEAAGTLFYLR